MGELESCIAEEYAKLSDRLAIVVEECGYDLNDDAFVERMLHISEHFTDPATEKEPKLADLALAMALRFAWDRRANSSAVSLKCLCFGNWLAGMVSILIKSDITGSDAARAFLTKSIKSELGKFAVSHRPEPPYKQEWIAHCHRVMKSGREVRTINDLLDIPGYPVEAAKIPATTLKNWAKEVGFEFLRGRPKNNK